MEKFGIFELLDTLSALTAAGNAARGESQPPDAEAQSAPQAAPPAARAAAPQNAPPAARAAAPAEQQSGQTRGSDAFAAFLARHDETRRRAEKRK